MELQTASGDGGTRALAFDARLCPRCAVEVHVVRCGSDMAVSICGGDEAHIGAVALAENDGVPSRGATVSVLSAHGHRDGEIAMQIARTLATHLHNRVSVSVGIHIENATQGELVAIVSASEMLTVRILDELHEADVDCLR